MPFFHYSQNNSGGSFRFDRKRGITHHVVIEADNYQDANDRAERIGLYFDGAGDCPCCGHRWSAMWSGEKGEREPSIYGESAIGWNSESGRIGIRWMKPDPEAVIHYRDGRVEWVTGDPVQEAGSPVAATPDGQTRSE